MYQRVTVDVNHNDTTPVCVTVFIAKKDISNAAITLSALQFAYKKIKEKKPQGLLMNLL